MRKTVVMSIFIMLTINTIYAQINGVVKDITGEPVMAANVFWLNTTNGTTTDAGGNFSIAKPSDNDKLVVSFIGYENDTILVKDNSKDIAVTLKCGVLMRQRYNDHESCHGIAPLRIVRIWLVETISFIAPSHQCYM